jgi:sulfur-oxidizing protein SoxY
MKIDNEITGDIKMLAGRRLIIKSGLSLLALAALPRMLLAGQWPQNAFAAIEANTAMAALFGGATPAPSSQVTLEAPVIAENGAVVPIEVKTTLEGVESISIVVEKNPRPLAALFEIPPGTLPEIASRIKMGQTSKVLAVVKTADGLFSAEKVVKVTIGGCGG